MITKLKERIVTLSRNEKVDKILRQYVAELSKKEP